MDEGIVAVLTPAITAVKTDFMSVAPSAVAVGFAIFAVSLIVRKVRGLLR